jgi:hypothetical protein
MTTFRVRILLAMFATGAVIGSSIPQAHADPAGLVSTYATGATNAVCETLTAYPSFAGIEGVMQGIAEDGFTTNQSAEVVVIAVERGCPQFLGLLQDFADSAKHGVAA